MASASSSAAGPPPAEPTAERADATMRSRQFVGLLAIVSVVGVVVSLAAWCFMEGVYQLQQELFVHLPHALGYNSGAPTWWPLPVLGIGGLLAALAITRLPGAGGHLPARGLSTGGTPTPLDLPGVILAAVASLGFGLIVGPEAPLIAIGGGVAVLTIGLARRPTPPQALTIIAASGSFAALSFIFTSPLIAAVILIEATALGGARMRLVLIPGLLGAGIGSLISLGIGSFSGLSTSAYALGPIALPHFGRPTLAEFGWSILLAILVAVIARPIMVGGLRTHRIVAPRMVLALPVVALLVAGLAIAFHLAANKPTNAVLFDGQAGLPILVGQAGAWSLGALALLILCKGLAYSLSLGSFRGGPTFPAMFLGAAAGIMLSHAPGFSLAPGVAVGIGAAVVAILRLPLSAVVLATLLTTQAGTGDEPLIIVGVVVALLVTLVMTELMPAPADAPALAASGPGAGDDAAAEAARAGAVTDAP